MHAAYKPDGISMISAMDSRKHGDICSRILAAAAARTNVSPGIVKRRSSIIRALRLLRR